MKRVVLTIIMIVVLTSTVQAHGFPYYSVRRPVVVYRSPVIHRVYVPRYSYGYRHRYGYENDRIAIAGNIGMGVLGMLLEDKQNDRAMDLAQQEQDIRLNEQIEARKEAERQEMFAMAGRLKTQQAQRENEKLRQEIERLQLELEMKKLQEELNK